MPVDAQPIGTYRPSQLALQQMAYQQACDREERIVAWVSKRVFGPAAVTPVMLDLYQEAVEDAAKGTTEALLGIRKQTPTVAGEMVRLNLGEAEYAQRRLAAYGQVVTALASAREVMARPQAAPTAALTRPRTGLSQNPARHLPSFVTKGVVFRPLALKAETTASPSR